MRYAIKQQALCGINSIETHSRLALTLFHCPRRNGYGFEYEVTQAAKLTA
ncbi:MAG TPA: hypothetical protein VLT36_12395 [Candidatus Dormibacteraeota bacterium]|nr:hypothetical protein [Candidatus Dormibacteraeota bacterium]